MTLIELTGIVATVFSIGSLMIKPPKVIMGGFVISNSLWAAHYFLQAELTAALILAANAIRSFSGAFAQQDLMKPTVFVFVTFVWIVCLLTFGGITSLLSAIASTLVALAMLYRETGIKFRLVKLVGFLVWLAFGIVTASIPYIITMCVQLLVLLGAIAIYDLRLFSFSKKT